MCPWGAIMVLRFIPHHERSGVLWVTSDRQLPGTPKHTCSQSEGPRLLPQPYTSTGRGWKTPPKKTCHTPQTPFQRSPPIYGLPQQETTPPPTPLIFLPFVPADRSGPGRRKTFDSPSDVLALGTRNSPRSHLAS